MNVTRDQITDRLKQDGYRPFLKTVVGSLVKAEAWTHGQARKRTVIVLYREDTGEVVDGNNIPDDEQRRHDLIAFMDDFRESVFCRQ